MSNFVCEHCGALICDSPRGYVTGCPHYPVDAIMPLCTSFAPDKPETRVVSSNGKTEDVCASE